MAELPEKTEVNVLRLRDATNAYWLNNFCAGAWKVRNPNNDGWIEMTPDNTQVRNADDSGWLELGCPDLGDPFWHYMVDPPEIPVIPTTTPAPTEAPTTLPPTTASPTTAAPTTAAPTTAPPTTAAPTTAAPTPTYPIELGRMFIYPEPVTSATLPQFYEEADALAAIIRSGGGNCMQEYRLWWLDDDPDDPSDWRIKFYFDYADNINIRVNDTWDFTGSTHYILTHKHDFIGQHYVSFGSTTAKSYTPRGARIELVIMQTGECDR
jgi:hypothetical protein